MMLDEMTAPGRIPIIAESISYLPGYNVRVVMIIHAPAQLREVYGIYNSETMLKSLAARIVFAPKDFNDAREISDELGFTTVKVKTVSKGGTSPFESRGGRSRTQNVSEQRRALLLPQEVKELGSEEAIIFYEGLRPIRCQKIRYYADAAFVPVSCRRPENPRRTGCPPPRARCTRRPREQPKRLPTPRRIRPPKLAAGRIGTGTLPRRAARRLPWRPHECVRPRSEDVERIGSLTLEDYATDFSKIPIPNREGSLTAKEMAAAADNFMDALEVR